MKILIVIESKDYSKSISDHALRFVGRLGYSFKLFVPKTQRHKYRSAIDDANWDWFLNIKYEAIEYKKTVEEYIQTGEYDLLIRLPDDTKVPENVFEDSIVKFIYKVGKARLAFSKQPKKRIAKLGTGVYMERLTK